MSLGTLFPKNVNVYGSARYPGLVGTLSVPATCGVVCFRSAQGNEGYLYIDGTNPMTLMFGGVTEVMTNPAGGVAIGAAIAAVTIANIPPIPDGWTLFGGPRVSAAIMINFQHGSGLMPAIGIMNNVGADINYLFMTDDGITLNLMRGDEAAWIAGTGTLVAGPVTASGARGVRIEGRSVVAEDWRRARNAFVIQSSGKSGALALMNGNYTSAYAIAIDPVTKDLHLDTVPGWRAWV